MMAEPSITLTSPTPQTQPSAPQTSILSTPTPPSTSRPTTSTTTRSETNSIAAATHPALATSKRKFHKILENLTRPSSHKRPHDSTNSIPFHQDSPAKRVRLEARSRLDAASSRPPPTAVGANKYRAEARARVDAQLLRSRLEAARAPSSRTRASEERSKTLVKEPNYNPWSHAAFLKRLSTYSNVRLWSSKPDAINEVAWSKRGWVCVDLNTVACRGGCEERVVVGLRPPLKDVEGKEVEGSEDMNVDVAAELVEKVKELIVGAHQEECLWRGGGCRDDVYRLPIARQAVWETELKDRYSGFAKTESKLPDLTNIESAVDAGYLGQCLPPDFLGEEASIPQTTTNSDTEAPSDAPAESSTTLDIRALTFALHGWSLSPDSTADYPLASCSACFRRLGLWLYTERSEIAPSDYTSNSTTSTSNSVPPMHLNLPTEHRTHCPYTNPISQHMTGSLTGLDGIHVLARCIENAARFRESGRFSEGGLSSHPVGSGSSLSLAGSADASMGGVVNGVDGQIVSEHTTADLAGAGEEVEHNHKAKKRKLAEAQAAEDKARFARLRALTKTLKLKGLGMRLRGRQFN